MARPIGKILEILYSTYPEAECALRHQSALELLVATILSAQCTDTRVNVVTSQMFKKYKTTRDYAEAGTSELEKDIRSTGFFRNKAKSLQGACRAILENFGGEVPSTMEELRTLPGVGRKTANVLLGTWFRKAEGVVVDTHVARVTKRLGLTRRDEPEKIERDLQSVVPRKDWIQFSHMVIWHGRKTCVARKPKCDVCPLAPVCPSAGKFHVKPRRRP